MPLVPAFSDPAPYPVEALGPLKDYAEAIHQLTEAPVEICAQSVLGAAALAVQGLADAELPHGGTCPISLFLLTIAQSGERKNKLRQAGNPRRPCFRTIAHAAVR
jgi:hypothetical protein